LNNFGKQVEFTWYDLPNHNNHIVLDAFVVMPNHIHGIIVIDGDGNRAGLVGDVNRAGLEPAPTGVTLAEIVRQFKTFSAKRINLLRTTSGCPV
jgi:putative transposase